MEEQLTNRNSRIVVLENQVKNQQFGFSELLQNERKKADLQAELFDHAQSISEVYKEENTHLKKKVRGLKWQRAGLGIAVIAVLILGTAQ